MSRGKEIKIERKINKKEFFDTFLKLIGTSCSGNQKLSDSERELLVEFMSLPQKHKYNRFSTLARKIVRANLDKGKTHVNSYLYALEKKRYIQRDEEGIYVLSRMLEEITDVDLLELKFKFTIKDE